MLIQPNTGRFLRLPLKSDAREKTGQQLPKRFLHKVATVILGPAEEPGGGLPQSGDGGRPLGGGARAGGPLLAVGTSVKFQRAIS